MTRIHACIPALALLSTVAPGCGGDSSGSGDGGADAQVNPPALEDLPQALEDAVCELAVRCGLMPDLATCQATFVYLQDFETIRAAVNNGLMEAIESGKYFELYEKWFGPKGEVPYPLTPENKRFLQLQVVPK